MPTDPEELDGPAEMLDRLGAEPVPPIRAEFANRVETELRAQHGDPRTRPASFGVSSRLRIGVAASIVVLAGVIGITQLGGEDRVPLEVSTAATTEAQELLAERDGSGGDAAGEDSDSDASLPTTPRTPAPSVAEPSATPTPAALVAGGTADAPGEAQPPTVEPTVPAPTTTPPPIQPSLTPTPAPTITPVPTASVEPTPAASSDVAVSPVPQASPEPTPTNQPAASSTPTTTPSPAPTASPVPTAAPPASPTVTPTPTLIPATPEPVPTVPIATATPETTSTTTPAATPEPIEIPLTCQVRVVASRPRVACSWRQATEPIDEWAVLRIRNGGEREVVQRNRPDSTDAVDVLVRSGDEIVYAVQGLMNGVVLVDSVLAPISVP